MAKKKSEPTDRPMYFASPKQSAPVERVTFTVVRKNTDPIKRTVYGVANPSGHEIETKGIPTPEPVCIQRKPGRIAHATITTPDGETKDIEVELPNPAESI